MQQYNPKIENFRDESHQWKFYKERFFRDSDIVVRAPGGFFFFGEHAVMYGHPAVYKAIPLYLYVGLKRTYNNDIVFDEYYELKFEFESPERPRKINNIEPLSDNRKRDATYTTKLLLEALNLRGYSITIMSEIPSLCGLDCAGAFSAAISSAIFLYNLDIAKEIVRKWVKLDTTQMNSERLEKDWKEFDKVFRLAWKIESLFHDFGSSGAGVMNAFLGSPDGLPIFFTGVKRWGKPDTYKECGPEAHILRMIDGVAKPRASLRGEELAECSKLYDTLDYWGYRWRDLVRIRSSARQILDKLEKSIDIYLIFSGDIKWGGTGAIIAKSKSKQEKAKMVQKEIHSLAKQEFGESNKDMPYFYSLVKHAVETGNKYFLAEQPFLILSSMAQHGIVSLNHDFKQGKISEDIIKYVNFTQALLDFADVSSVEINKICNYLAAEYDPRCEYSQRESFDYGVGCKLTGAGGGGDVVIIDPRELINRDIGRVLSHPRKEVKGELLLHYCSREDGLRAAPLTIIKEPDDNLILERIKEFSEDGNWFGNKIEAPSLREVYLKLAEEANKRLSNMPYPEVKGDIYTDHGPKHSIRNMKYCFLLSDYFTRLHNDYERFVLLLACWFHDIGMIKHKRKNHGEDSNDIIYNDSVIRKIIPDSPSRRLLGSICQAHTSPQKNKKDFLEKLREEQDFEVQGSILKIRPKFLASLLRVADACDLDKERAVEKATLEEFPGTIDSACAHHLCHTCIDRVKITHSRIDIFAYEDSEALKYFSKGRVERHITQTVRSSLGKGGINLTPEKVRFHIVSPSKRKKSLQKEYDELLAERGSPSTKKIEDVLRGD